jgi:FAD dependent oxidoreductase TIGR03364
VTLRRPSSFFDILKRGHVQRVTPPNDTELSQSIHRPFAQGGHHKIQGVYGARFKAASKGEILKSDVIIVGSGIVGMACAWAALQQGKSVRVIDRDPFCVGASIRNFGFVTVTGQGSGDTWRRARRSRDVWADLAPKAGIDVAHQGLFVLAQRPQAQVVLQELLARPEGADLRWLNPTELARQAPHLAHAHVLGALYSPHEIRIESRVAVEQLRLYLASQGVVFHMGQTTQQVIEGAVLVADAWLTAERIVVCPGPDIRHLFPEAFQQNQTQLCQLQMLRVQPPAGYRLGAGVMGDLSLVRYRGYSEMPGAPVLRQQLQAECGPALENGIHLIVVQSQDGSLVVGDSHHYGPAMPPFASQQVESLILEHMQQLLCLDHYQVTQRWTGIYPSASHDAMVRQVLPGVQLVSVTSGTGMSTSFGLAEEVIQSWSAA